ncbi:hypothetical protein APUTEX25_001761 [Auxenochlorella protothecoides]|uniref:Amine oxidase domain-containing protein n=2 Tax=Auxenochlorella protothecoides TaxID=3075 RepID=A0A3M7L4A4_AUXPR|nr:hypothetical protein APUTEX25_001761 [Auxenochlorella protothecoides]|eukprot:RMZ57561.1 hypothetical protein APUTEX25_001761 [Auxenochlorella protothecoides]
MRGMWLTSATLVRARHVPHAVGKPALQRPGGDPVVIIGAGLAGLNAALTLEAAGRECVVLEAQDGVGGRVRTDRHEGFLLDRGFQIFLTSYPEAQRLLDYDSLELHPFFNGAVVRTADGAMHTVADPFRHPVPGLLSLLNPVGSPLDKLRVGLLRLRTQLTGAQSLLATSQETTTLERLQARRRTDRGSLIAEGFSDVMIDAFFRPFLGGIFFDTGLQTSSRLLLYVLCMLASGSNCLPASGIGAIPEQLAARLRAPALRLNTRVQGLTPGSGSWEVKLGGGETLHAPAAIVATEGPAARQLLGARLAPNPSAEGPGVGSICLYFAMDGNPPRSGPYLFLNGDTRTGLVNNLCFPSEVVPGYAPEGQSLASVSVIGDHADLDDAALEKRVRGQLSSWFGVPLTDNACFNRVTTGAALGGALGASIGSLYGTFEAFRYRIPGMQKIRYIGKTTTSSAAVFGLFLGAGSLLHCGR